MASINAGANFAKRKACTTPETALPANLKKFLCIDKAYANGIFKLEPMKGSALYDRCYIFEDVNYINKDEDKKMNMLLELMKLFKSMSGQFKITLASEQHDMHSFMEDIFTPIHGENYPLLEAGIGRWICQKIEEGTRDIKRILLLTITCRAKSVEEAGTYFATLDTALSGIFYALKSRLYCMSGVERLRILQRMLRAGGQGLPVSAEMLEDGTDNWKNQILPTMINTQEDYMKIDNRFATVLYAHDYDQSLNEEKVIHSLSDVLFPVYITLDMEPVRKRILKERLLYAHTNNEKTMAQERSSNFKIGQFGAGNSYTLTTKKTELESMMDQVDGNDEDAVFLGLLIFVPADTEKELEEHVDSLMQIAVTNGFTLDPYYHQQLKAFNTVLPIGGRQVNHMRSLVTSSAVAFQPFYAKDLQDGDFVYGLNTTTKQLIRGDRKKLPAPHGMMVGHSGFGKSFLIKETEIAQTLLFTDDDVIIIDPNNEQDSFIESLGGQFFDFTPQCEIHLNPFEVPRYVLEGDSTIQNIFIAQKTDYAVSFCTAVMTNIVVNQVHMNYIGRAVRRMYEEYFAKKLSWSRSKGQPTLCRIRELLTEEIEKVEYREDKRILLDIVDSLEAYTTGVYDMFAHPSNLDIDNRLIGFGLKHIPDSVWEPAMLTIMHFLTMRIDYNNSKFVALRLIVDEAQFLCARESTAVQLLHAVETYRKVGAVVTLAVQNLTRVLENDKLRDMFSNCPYKCFLDLGGVDAMNLSAIQELSSRELQEIENPKKGHGVLSWNGQVYLFDAFMAKDNPMYASLDTDFHEKAEERRAKELEAEAVSDKDMKESAP